MVLQSVVLLGGLLQTVFVKILVSEAGGLFGGVADLGKVGHDFAANKDKAQEGSSVHEMLILLQPRDERLESASETHHTTASILGRTMTLSIILTKLSNLLVKLSKITQKIPM